MPCIQKNKRQNQLARPPKFFLAVFLLIFAFGSCEASAAMEFSRKDAAADLKQGDISFILSMESSRVHELAKLDPSFPFYAGLLVESAGDKIRSARLYEAALSSPVPKVKSEAARKLVPLLTESKDTEQAKRIIGFLAKTKDNMEEFVTLKGAALYGLGRYAEISSLFEKTGRTQKEKSGNARTSPEPLVSGKAAEEFESWNRAFRFLSAVMRQKPGPLATEDLRPFLFDFPVNAAYRWAWEELSAGDHVLPAAEKAAAAGRLAVLGRSYAEALLYFDTARNTQPSLFFNHDSLLGDLGRAYTQTASRRDAGLKLFTEWESAIKTEKNSPAPFLNETDKKAVRYTLLFYAGRIRRQQNKHGEAAEFFTQALALAPLAAQEDNCIWYILNSAFTEKPETVPALVKTYAGRWHKDSEFYDILDKLSCYLVGQKKWNDLLDVFFAVKNGKDGSIIARYAYLAGRAVSLGYVQGRNMSARDYFTVAYEEGNASFYYRALAASHLGKTVVPVKNQGKTAGNDFTHGDELEFYVKFFEYGASSYVMAYVRENAPRYTGRELRTLAGTFAASGRYLESIQIMGLYMRRDNYVMEKADLELYYPKHYTELIEKNARANGLHPSLFFGLVRTESAFMSGIASHAGAVGLAQIMPNTGKELAALIKKRGGPDYAAGGAVDLTDPAINVHIGTVYLKDLTNSMGSPMLALLSYNAGPSRIRRFRRETSSLPEDLFIETITIAETRNYGKQVMAAAAAYGYLYYGMSMHEVVAGIFK